MNLQLCKSEVAIRVKHGSYINVLIYTNALYRLDFALPSPLSNYALYRLDFALPLSCYLMMYVRQEIYILCYQKIISVHFIYFVKKKTGTVMVILRQVGSLCAVVYNIL